MLDLNHLQVGANSRRREWERGTLVRLIQMSSFDLRITRNVDLDLEIENVPLELAKIFLACTITYGYLSIDPKGRYRSLCTFCRIHRPLENVDSEQTGLFDCADPSPTSPVRFSGVPRAVSIAAAPSSCQAAASDTAFSTRRTSCPASTAPASPLG